ncbi:hypothetical protein BGZ60DRAFT_518796 [Tricladium varicosporioides]|nr:hypothetical protein BGZ60DRAFT_518796 [Hymenoscyphus varicosporioides]
MKPSTLLSITLFAITAVSQQFELFITTTVITVPPINGSFLSTNGTHVGIFPTLTPLTFTSSPGPQPRTNILHLPNAGDTHKLGLVGPTGILRFFDLESPETIIFPPGIVGEWDLWRMLDGPSQGRLRMADMSARTGTGPDGGVEVIVMWETA